MMSSTCEDTPTLAIGVASCAQWAPVLEWAHQEQWNLGHDDVQHFMNVDPEGFFVGRKAGNVVTALSVVNHTPDFAFIGHYLTDPEHRHQGYGSTLWRQAIQHAGTRCIGLDAIEAQIPNYRKWGFESCYRVHRVTGMAQPIASPAVAEAPARLTDEMIPAVVALEARHLGYARPRLLVHGRGAPGAGDA